MPIPGTVQLTAIVAPTSTADTYPVIDPIYSIDGLRNISGDTTALNSVPFQRRRQGMLVGLNSTTGTTYYRLKPEPWVSATTDWSILINATGGTGGGGGDVTYTNSTPVPEKIGGIAGGSTFSNNTMQQMWDLLLYPYQSPAFTSFSLVGIGTPLEMGQTIGVNQTFSWGTSNPGNVSANTISINGYNLIPPLNGLNNDSSEPVTFNNPINRIAADGPGVRQWTISAINTNGIPFNAALTLRWDYRMYVGTSTNPILTANEITGLTVFNSVKAGFAGSYPLPAGGYKFICFADTYGTPNTWTETIGNFAFALFAGYPNTDERGNKYELIPITNSFGQTTNYKVYRSENQLAGNTTLLIT